ncbi:hypothetical protein AVEN_88206-1 [Araneus ventricosus]|uniref:Uncharacterized protein n=1 Tax=Araneus ventricosus TaxID=182803 RepID=A0A4Y2INI2_ARAVE|nr:hypothetical protein AVEN_88206-1 [Araneus ventricosus]
MAQWTHEKGQLSRAWRNCCYDERTSSRKRQGANKGFKVDSTTKSETFVERFFWTVSPEEEDERVKKGRCKGREEDFLEGFSKRTAMSGGLDFLGNKIGLGHWETNFILFRATSEVGLC